MAILKHISSKNADYGDAEKYLTFEHDEFTMKPTLDADGRLIPRTGYRISSLNCDGEDFAIACIANALMEQEVSVCMTNFAAILNDLAASFKERNEYISRLCSFPLLILDDFGMERGTEYGLEQVYNVIDSRYRSGKPLIVTTNLTLEELQNPEDTAHARIYDRLLEMCSPVCITGENFRKATAQAKMERLKTLLAGKEI